MLIKLGRDMPRVLVLTVIIVSEKTKNVSQATNRRFRAYKVLDVKKNYEIRNLSEISHNICANVDLLRGHFELKNYNIHILDK